MIRSRRATMFFVCGVAFTFAMVPLSRANDRPEPPAGLVSSGPVSCAGDEDVVISNRLIRASGDAIVASGDCDVVIRNCYIVAGGIAILATGDSNVTISDSYVEGAAGAILARDDADVLYSRCTLSGGVKASGDATLLDQGGNKVVGTGVVRGSTGAVGADGGTTVKLGPGGVVVGADDGTQVDIGQTVGVASSDGLVVVDGGAVRIQDGGDVTTVSGDWRHVTVATYGESDTDRIMVELGAKQTGTEIQLQLTGDVLFDFGSSTLRSDAKAQLAKVAHLIRQRSAGEIKVVGHTDSIGTEKKNLELSQARAVAVMRWLNQHEGIPGNLMLGQGLGSKKPVAHNTMPDGSDNTEGRAKNRRVEINFASAR